MALSAQTLQIEHQPEVLPIHIGDDTLTVTYNMAAITPDFLDGIFTRPIRHLLADILLNWDLPTSPDEPSPYVPQPVTESEALANDWTTTQVEVERKNRWRLLLGTLPQDFLRDAVYVPLKEDFLPGKRRATS